MAKQTTQTDKPVVSTSTRGYNGVQPPIKTNK